METDYYKKKIMVSSRCPRCKQEHKKEVNLQKYMQYPNLSDFCPDCASWHSLDGECFMEIKNGSS